MFRYMYIHFYSTLFKFHINQLYLQIFDSQGIFVSTVLDPFCF